ncbi:uncharacterized protein N7483_002242 [Penicillium malachiteum]|uniref:uncharacterized protein n=1 Tax=Penicillium malachiteum TaxID=1324776 RepID=UPI0025477B6C|nr:uncharacterized protein N7483_002242 [Penicillium malachiteum]KAJ5737117.1 hypothetical protein N7483_002242 [Penicillium malachiteum]
MESINFGDGNSGCQVGINNGVMSFTPKQPELRPEPLWTVPFPHDPDFVSRDGILKTIHEKSSVPGSRIVLVGLGGVGKTRLVIEYCHRVRQQSTDTWVFWVHASTAARCEESLRNLADRAKIPGREDRNVNIFQLFGNWLQDGNIGKWILVLDNVDDDGLLRNPLATRTDARANVQDHTSMQPPLRYLLGASNGSIIITSRNKAVASEIAGHKKNLIDVQPMNMPEALDLMQHKLGSYAERADLVQLVTELEFMPLAIIQAASYIAHRSPRCSVSQYLEKLRQSDRQATKLLNHEELLTDRDWEAKNSILLTWQISFDHIRRIRQSAADLLSLMSFFDWQGIPEDLLRVQEMAKNHEVLGSLEEFANSPSGEDTESSSEYDLDDNFESDITTLRDYSFVTTNENCMVFTMHRLVQLTVRTWLKTDGQYEDWKERFIKNLHAEFPTGQYEHWERCRTLFPHVKSAMSHRPKSQDCLRSWAGLLYKGACWREAEQLEMQVMGTRKTKLGVDHPDTLSSMANLALTYIDQGRWEEAEQLLVQVIKTYKTKLGVDHPDMMTRMADLALTYMNQGRWEEAEHLEMQVMGTRKTKLGVDHPNTLTSMANLASTYMNQGRWEEADQLFVQVMKTRKTKLGVDHPSTLTSMANLALAFGNQGRWEEAEQLLVQVIETCKTKLGVDHPNTLTSMANLASTYIYQGRWDEAEQLLVQVIETCKTKLGVDHPNTLTSMANLALAFGNQGRWEEAEQLEVHVIETCKTKLGVDHPNTLTSMANLAHTLRSSGQCTAALQLMTECVQLCDRKLGPNHPHTASSKSALNEWRGTVDSLSSQLTKPPTDTKKSSILGSSIETSEQV